MPIIFTHCINATKYLLRAIFKENELASSPLIFHKANIYILLGAFFWNTGWYFLRVLKVFDEPLGDNIFIVKLKKFYPWGKNIGVQI